MASPPPARSPASQPWPRGLIGHDRRDRLEAAFARITALQLRQQIADFGAGRPVGNFLDPKTLTEREVDLLKDSFRAINDLRDQLRSELTGEVF